MLLLLCCAKSTTSEFYAINRIFSSFTALLPSDTVSVKDLVVKIKLNSSQNWVLDPMPSKKTDVKDIWVGPF